MQMTGNNCIYSDQVETFFILWIQIDWILEIKVKLKTLSNEIERTRYSCLWTLSVFSKKNYTNIDLSSSIDLAFSR